MTPLTDAELDADALEAQIRELREQKAALKAEVERLMAIDAAGLHPACMDLQYAQNQQIAALVAALDMHHRGMLSADFAPECIAALASVRGDA